MTTDAETFDAAYERGGEHQPEVSERLMALFDLADEVGRVLEGRMLTAAERERLYLRATAIVEAGLIARQGWAARLLNHRRAMVGGAVAALAAAGAVGLMMHERRTHPRLPRLRLAA